MADQDLEFDLETGEVITPQVVTGNVVDQDDEDPKNLEDGAPAGNEEQGTGVRSDENTDDEDDEQHEQPVAGETDAEREAIRERRRQERRERKEAQRNREESLRREVSARDAQLAEMRARLDSIERQNNGSQMAQLENAIRETDRARQFFKEQIATATQAGNGAAVAEATDNLLKLTRRAEQLVSAKQAYTQRQSSPPPLDPRLAANAQQWMARNTWYDPSSGDLDSSIVVQIDAALGREGWNPTTQEYWDELDSRIKKYLPHRAVRAKVPTSKPKSVVSGSGRETTGAAPKGNTYRLSSERVQAIKDAGMWDDPKARADMIKRYRDQDAKNKA